MAGQERGPAAVLAPEGRCGRGRLRRRVRPEEEGLALHIRGPLQLRDRAEAPTRLSDRRAVLQPVLRADQVEPGGLDMAQTSEQACAHWETLRRPGRCLHVGQREDPRRGNSQVGKVSPDV